MAEEKPLVPHIAGQSHLAIVRPMARSQPVSPTDHPWVGRTGVFELCTGTRVSGRVIAVYDEYFDTDNGSIRKEAVVYARWMGAEEIAIARGGPLNSNSHLLNRRW
jgi:hypothetical protein